MKRFCLLACLVALPLQQTQAAGAAPAIFSDGFKLAVNASMNQPDKDKRTSFLIEALQHGNNVEVFHVFPILFPAGVLKDAQKAQVCAAQVDASVGNVSAFMAIPEGARQAFIDSHAAKIRSDTNRLVACLDQYWVNGKWIFPTTPPAGAIKPKPDGKSP